MLLMLLLTSCVSNKKVQVIYPVLTFPQFPKPKKATPLDKDLNKVTDNETEIKYVLIDYEYYIALSDFKLDLKEVEAKYNGFVEGVK